MSVYDTEAFAERVNFAAAFISAGRNSDTSRRFDTCFEMNDGDAVVAALVRRAGKNKRLAAKLFKYIGKAGAAKAAADLADIPTSGLPEKAREMREAARVAFDKFMADREEYL